LGIRKEALEHLNDNHPQKKRAETIMTKEYMSSEEEVMEVPGIRGNTKRQKFCHGNRLN